MNSEQKIIELEKRIEILEKKATAANNQSINSIVREVINEHYEQLISIPLTRE